VECQIADKWQNKLNLRCRELPSVSLACKVSSAILVIFLVLLTSVLLAPCCFVQSMSPAVVAT
jgi:hypothetical protein